MIIILEVLIAYQVQDDFVSNDFAVKGSESECFVIKSCGKWLFEWSSDVKGLSKKGGSIEPFKPPPDPPLYCISIIIGIGIAMIFAKTLIEHTPKSHLKKHSLA